MKRQLYNKSSQKFILSVRLARRRSTMVDGLILINCNSQNAGWVEWVYNKINLKSLRKQQRTGTGSQLPPGKKVQSIDFIESFLTEKKSIIMNTKLSYPKLSCRSKFKFKFSIDCKPALARVRGGLPDLVPFGKTGCGRARDRCHFRFVHL